MPPTPANSSQQPGMHQPVPAIFLSLAPPSASTISMLVTSAAAKCVKAGPRVPQQGPAPPILMVSRRLELLRNRGMERAVAIGPEEGTK